MKRRFLVVVLPLLLVGGVAGVVWLAVSGGPAAAGTASDLAKSDDADLVKYVQGGAALNLRLLAVEVLRKRDDSTGSLVEIVKGSDLATAAYGCAALGRQGSSDAKAALQDLVTNTKLGTEVRKAAMSAIAAHWKEAEDLKWFEKQTGSDSALKSHCEWLGTCVYEKQWGR
jgi:hypothetical protein